MRKLGGSSPQAKVRSRTCTSSKPCRYSVSRIGRSGDLINVTVISKVCRVCQNVSARDEDDECIMNRRLKYRNNLN